MAKLGFWKTLRDALATSEVVAEQLVGVERELPVAEDAARVAEEALVGLVLQREGGGKVEARAFDEAQERRDETRLRVLALARAKEELHSQLVKAAEREIAGQLTRTTEELAKTEGEMSALRKEGLLLAAKLFATVGRLYPIGPHVPGPYTAPSLGVLSGDPDARVVFGADRNLIYRLTGVPANTDLSREEQVFPVLRAAFEEAGLLEVTEAAPGMTPPPPAACLYARRLALQDELKRLKALSPAARAEEALARARTQEP